MTDSVRVRSRVRILAAAVPPLFTSMLLLVAGCTGKPVPGDPSRFDPVGMAEAMRGEAGEGYVLTRLDARGVRPDGTIDLTDKVVDGNVTYRFVRAVDPPADQPPLGAGGSAEAVWNQESRVIVRRRGWHHTGTRQEGGSTTKTYDRHRGLEVRRLSQSPGPPSDGIDLPTCSFGGLWQAALEAGAPENAVAEIDYYGDRYRFSIPGTDVRHTFNLDCTMR